MKGQGIFSLRAERVIPSCIALGRLLPYDCDQGGLGPELLSEDLAEDLVPAQGPWGGPHGLPNRRHTFEAPVAWSSSCCGAVAPACSWICSER